MNQEENRWRLILISTVGILAVAFIATLAIGERLEKEPLCRPNTLNIGEHDGMYLMVTPSSDEKSSSFDSHIVMVQDGELTNITEPQDDVKDVLPAWSPDGSEIIFSRSYLTEDRTTVSFSLWIYDISTEEQEEVFALQGKNLLYANFSPDGKSVVLEAAPHNQEEDPLIYVLDLETKNPQKLTEGHFPLWLDNSQIVFLRTGDPRNQPFVINEDGTGEKEIPWCE